MRLELPLQHWETQLIAWAQEPLQSLPHAHPMREQDGILDAAYRYCAALTRHHSKTFFIASGLLPADKRRAARALYAFCRVTDDLVDHAPPGCDPLARLEGWRSHLNTAPALSHDPVALAWGDAQARFHIPAGYAEQLIAGVARDVRQQRYGTFADLAEYSYGVASTVGLMAMYIVGFTDEDAVPYAVKLGVALQLTNILRDVGEDWRGGRLYLPQDELDAFGIDETHIHDGVTDARWRKFMAFQIDRTRRLYHESIPGIQLLNPEGRFAIGAAAELYRAILSDIEASGGDVFTRRASINNIGKLRRLPGIWWRSR